MGKKGISLAFFREDNYHKISIKLMGGLIVGGVGLLGLVGTLLSNSYNNNLSLYIFFSTYAIHLTNLLPIWGDGRQIAEMIVKSRLQGR